MQDIEADGTVVCLSDATPVYPEGEEWEVERENLRAGHPQEASGFGMLDLGGPPDAVHKTLWGSATPSPLPHVTTVLCPVMPCLNSCKASLLTLWL